MPELPRRDQRLAPDDRTPEFLALERSVRDEMPDEDPRIVALSVAEQLGLPTVMRGDTLVVWVKGGPDIDGWTLSRNFNTRFVGGDDAR